MKKERLKETWLHEQEIAHIHGWDFSHLNGRYTEESDLPWDYRTLIKSVIRPEMKLLDIDTGGGEFLLSLEHPMQNVAATEGYPPNVELCRKELLPLGVDFREGTANALPFSDENFDLVINRHGDFCPSEIFRVLRPGGRLITQQVGALNDRDLVARLLPGKPLPFPEMMPEKMEAAVKGAGMKILRLEETFRPIRFYDTGALVWFARIIEWEFPGFSVEEAFDRLLAVENEISQVGFVEGSIHRILLEAEKEG